MLSIPSISLQAFAPSIYIFMISRCILGIAAYGRFLTGVLLSKIIIINYN